MYVSVVNPNTGGIYATNNLSAGASAIWTKLSSPPRTQGHPNNINVLNNGELVVTYSARRTTVFTASSGVFYSAGGGVTWFGRTLSGAKGSPGMQYWTKDITIDPTDPQQNTWWAAVRSGYGGDGSSNDKGGLYKTTDRGLTWTPVFAGDSVESCTITAAGEMYVATTNTGLWYAPSVASPTPAFTQTNYPFAQPERVFINPYNANDVWVASFGYGLAQGTNAFAVLKGDALDLNASITGSVIGLTSGGGTITASAGGNSYVFPAASVGSIVLNGTAGADSLVINASLGKPVFLSGGGGSDTLTVNAGTTTLTSDVGTTTIRPTVTVAAGATLITASSQHPGTVNVNGNVTLANDGSRLLNLTGLAVGAGGVLDLTNNAMQLQYSGASPRNTIESLFRTARADGTWSGTGITSTAAANDVRYGTALGIMDAAEYRSVYGASATFSSDPIAPKALLLRYTLYGDTDLDRGVSINDFNRLATAFGRSGRTWAGGDFDLDGGTSINDFDRLAATFGRASP